MGLSEKAAIAGGVGVGVAVALPVIAVAGVAVLGFHYTGIASGSIAASMMSSSAIAFGGGVPVGGLVATLQSIGAAGIGVGASADVGTVASGTTAALIAIFV